VNTTFGHMAPQQGNARITAMLSTVELTSGITASLLPINSWFSFLAANVFNHVQFLRLSASRGRSPQIPHKELCPSILLGLVGPKFPATLAPVHPYAMCSSYIITMLIRNILDKHRYTETTSYLHSRQRALPPGLECLQLLYT